jgi:hypothetical protein
LIKKYDAISRQRAKTDKLKYSIFLSEVKIPKKKFEKLLVICTKLGKTNFVKSFSLSKM